MSKSVRVRATVFTAGCMALGLLATTLATGGGGSPEARAAEKEKPRPNYVGTKNCKLCHSEEKTGDQYGQWKKSKHAQAYETLGTAKAKEIAAKQGIANPQKDLKCTKCHVTGAEEPALTKKLKAAEGIQCETCHGAGEFYAKDEVFKQGKAAAVAKGLIEPDEKLCVKCHNKESPTFPGEFKFKEMWEKVKHPNPEKKGAPKEK